MGVRIEEKSLELALVKAAGKLGVTQDELDYKVVNESTGFLGLFGKKVAIEAWKKRSPHHKSSHRKRDPIKHSGDFEHRADAPPLTQEDKDRLVDELTAFCAELCERIAHSPCDIDVEMDDDRVVFHISNEIMAAQFVKNAKLAESIEHILRKKPRHLKQELPFRIFVDANGIRQNREEELITMANELSNKVSKSKKPVVLNYRSSYDRKIIHMALDKDVRVYTKSIGTGPNRKLMILPSRPNANDAAGLEDET